MLKLSLEYVDYDGNKQVEDLYFNISTTELANREIRSNGRWFQMLKEVQESNDGQQIMDRFDEIIGLAYGERSEDGKYFRKSQQIIDDFRSTAAYDAFFLKVCTNAEYAAEFINKVLPAELIAAVKKAQDEQQAAIPPNQPQVIQDARLVDISLNDGSSQPSIPRQAPTVWPPQDITHA